MKLHLTPHQHEGEEILTEFAFFGELILYLYVSVIPDIAFIYSVTSLSRHHGTVILYILLLLHSSNVISVFPPNIIYGQLPTVLLVHLTQHESDLNLF